LASPKKANALEWVDIGAKPVVAEVVARLRRQAKVRSRCRRAPRTRVWPARARSRPTPANLPVC